MVWAVAYWYFPNFVQPMFKEGVMSTNNIKPNHTKKGQQEIEPQNALILMNSYSTVELSELEQLCSANNLKVDHVTHNYNLHDVRPYKEMIKYIVKQKTPPVVLTDFNIRIFPQCVMASTMLGTLEAMNLVKIHTYNKYFKEQNKGYNLVINKNYNVDLLTDASWQVRYIKTIYKQQMQDQIKAKKNETN
jgi:hypothetical protein